MGCEEPGRAGARMKWGGGLRAQVEAAGEHEPPPHRWFTRSVNTSQVDTHPHRAPAPGFSATPAAALRAHHGSL